MASAAAATTSLPDAILRTLFNHLPDAASLQRSLGQFGWDLLRNTALPAAGVPAAKAHLAAPAPVHAAAAKPQGEIRMLFDVPTGTRISSRADGTASHVGVARGPKPGGTGPRAALRGAHREGGATVNAVSGDSRTGRIQTADAAAQAAPAGTTSSGRSACRCNALEFAASR